MNHKTVFDVIVVGLGTVGAATLMELARRGVKVLGLDTHRPPHTLGSHHGESRSIRRAYLEGTTYVPMVRRAWMLWRRLEKDTGTDLLARTGNLTIAPVDAPALEGFLASARRYDIPHELLSAAEVHRRWPQLEPSDDLAAGLELEAGLLAPELALSTMLAEAQKANAHMHFDECVRDWSLKGGGVQIRTSRSQYHAGRILLATGAGTRALLGAMGKLLAPKRVPVHWLAPPAPRDFELGVLPVTFWQLPATGAGSKSYHEFYALPVTRAGGWIKVAKHNHLANCDPLTMDREVRPDEVAEIQPFLENCIPSLAPAARRSEVCLYNLTLDGDFILGPLPGHTQVMTAALAGHGFKFAPVLGEIMADLLVGRPPAFDLAPFGAGRFS